MARNVKETLELIVEHATTLQEVATVFIEKNGDEEAAFDVLWRVEDDLNDLLAFINRRNKEDN